MRLSLLLTLTLFTGSVYSQELTARQIFDNMLATYDKASTYQDAGTVTTRFYNAGETEPDHTNVLHFETAFDRSAGQFRFHSYQDKSVLMNIRKICYQVVANEKGTRSGYAYHKELERKQEPSLGAVLSKFNEPSGSSSRKIPGLLVKQPITGGWDLRKLKDLKLLGTETQGGRPAYRLEGTVWNQKKAQVWIDRELFLILRVDENYANSKTTLTYRPVVNKPLKASAFAFNPEACLTQKSGKLLGIN